MPKKRDKAPAYIDQEQWDDWGRQARRYQRWITVRAVALCALLVIGTSMLLWWVGEYAVLVGLTFCLTRMLHRRCRAWIRRWDDRNAEDVSFSVKVYTDGLVQRDVQ